MRIPSPPENIATNLAEELALLSVRATVAGLSLTAYLIDMAHAEVMREAVKIALPHGQAQIMRAADIAG